MYDLIVLIIVFIDKVLNIPRGNKKMMNIQKSHREQHNNEYSSYISFFFKYCFINTNYNPVLY